MATAIIRFDRSNSLQAIWPVASQIVTAYIKTDFTFKYYFIFVRFIPVFSTVSDLSLSFCTLFSLRRTHLIMPESLS